jgi:hypothetical protein
MKLLKRSLREQRKSSKPTFPLSTLKYITKSEIKEQIHNDMIEEEFEDMLQSSDYCFGANAFTGVDIKDIIDVLKNLEESSPSLAKVINALEKLSIDVFVDIES